VIKGVQFDGQMAVLNPGGAAFYALDLVETIRQGLIGGNRGLVNGEEIKVTPTIANKLIDAYVLGQPLRIAWDIAATVLATAIRGFDPPKKEAPADERAKPRKTKKAASTSV
jgi:hypothetical protein